jgi:hypothetical protein
MKRVIEGADGPVAKLTRIVARRPGDRADAPLDETTCPQDADPGFALARYYEGVVAHAIRMGAEEVTVEYTYRRAK